MSDQAATAERFLALHHRDRPLLIPNPWDTGSAIVLASLGFEALATTSSGFAATLGRLDGSVTRDEALAHAATIVAATELPVSADLENAFADDPGGVAETIGLAIEAGLAGCSVEDFTGDEEDPIYELDLAARASRRRGRGGAPRSRAPRSHGARREPHPRPAEPGGHDLLACRRTSAPAPTCFTRPA